MSLPSEERAAELEVDFNRLKAAAKALYFAARWSADRPVDEPGLWAELRDAAGIPPGSATKAGVGRDTQATPSGGLIAVAKLLEREIADLKNRLRDSQDYSQEALDVLKTVANKLSDKNSRVNAVRQHPCVEQTCNHVVTSECYWQIIGVVREQLWDGVKPPQLWPPVKAT